MRKHLTKLLAFCLVLAMALPLAACGKKDTPNPNPAPTNSPTVDQPSDTPDPTAEPSQEPVPTADPEDAVRSYWSEDQLTQAWGPGQVVEHLFFHPVIAYPEFAFSSAVPQDRQEGLDDWMVTVDEFNKILQSVYEKGYILVNMCDVWSEYTNENGEQRMQRNTLMLPEGKKPLIMSSPTISLDIKPSESI